MTHRTPVASQAAAAKFDATWLTRAINFSWIAGFTIAALVALSGCTMDGAAPATSYENRMKEDFTRDRDNCRQVAEQTTPYVDPKNGKAVGERSYRVEGEIQKCMLNRGWNNPRFDGWKAGRN